MHIFLFFIFLLFIFLFLGWVGLNPAQHIYWWLGWAQPHRGWARPSQPGPVTGPSQWPAGQTADARVKHFHACINSAKVIKLPSHCSNAIWTQKSKNKWKRAHLFLEIAKKAAMLVGFDCFPFLAMVRKAVGDFRLFLLFSRKRERRCWFLWVLIFGSFSAGMKATAELIPLSV